MIIEFNNDIPIYIQIAQAIEDNIIKFKLIIPKVN